MESPEHGHHSPEAWVNRRGLIGLAVEEQARDRQADELLEKPPGIGLGHRLERVSVVATYVHVQRHVVRDNLVAGVG